MKRHIGKFLLAVLAVGGIAYVGAHELTAPVEDVVLAQENDEAPPAEGGPRGSGHKMRPGLHRAIRGEFVVPGEEEGTFRTVRIDRGLFERVDGSTVVIKEDDGTSVEVPTSEATRITRDGQGATLADFKEGDRVHAIRINEGDGFVTQGVRAISPERWEERQQRREERMQRRGQPPTGPEA